jgi:hypothetical protein
MHVCIFGSDSHASECHFFIMLSDALIIGLSEDFTLLSVVPLFV